MPAKRKLSPGEWRQDEERQPRDAQMRSSVAEFQAVAKKLTGQFRNDLADVAAECGRGCDPGILIQKVANNASRLEQKLTQAQLSSEAQLRRRAQELGGADSVLGAAGDLSRSLALIDLACLRASADVTESLSVLKEAPVGGESVFLTIRLLLREALREIPKNVRPIAFLAILTLSGGSRAFAYIEGSAPEGSAVNVTIACGAMQQTEQAVTNNDARWSVEFTLVGFGPSVCTVTANDFNGSASIDIQLH